MKAEVGAKRRKEIRVLYKSIYESPLGKIILTACSSGLTGLYFEGQKYFDISCLEGYKDKENAAIKKAKKWLDVYFSGQAPEIEVPLCPEGTQFQLQVWEILRTVPYGETITYGEIAKRIAAGRGLEHMSAQAVGGAVGHNKISIMIPCHRVIGADGSLTGFAGGVERKAALLALEKIALS